MAAHGGLGVRGVRGAGAAPTICALGGADIAGGGGGGGVYLWDSLSHTPPPLLPLLTAFAPHPRYCFFVPTTTFRRLPHHHRRCNVEELTVIRDRSGTCTCRAPLSRTSSRIGERRGNERSEGFDTARKDEKAKR
ncbi:hypothetical protein NL676_033822 [Syzygium grande]|nr:hypothetical protein NL676_033822 [Syzygium grande]